MPLANLLRSVTISAAMLCAVSVTSSAHAQQAEKRSFPYPDSAATLQDCKTASALAKTDVAAFLRTRCASEIRGVVYGTQLVANRVLMFEEEQGANGDQAETLTAIKNLVNNSICYPLELFANKQPMEMAVVDDIIAFLENDELKARVDARGPQPFLLAGVLEAIYRCPMP